MFTKITTHLVTLSVLAVSGVAHADKFKDAIQLLKKKQYAPAITQLKSLAKNNDRRAQHALGYLYKNGQGVSKDIKTGLSWYQKAADNGNANSMINLGLHYYRGNNGQRYFKKSLSWFQKAANRRHPLGISFVADQYRLAQGVKRDLELAVSLYKESANLGYPHAMFMLGAMHSTGKGTKKDKAKARYYYSLAAKKGHRQARRYLNHLLLAQKIKYKGVSQDPEYGYSAKKPINTGHMARGQHNYLRRLRGPKGEIIQYRRIGNCCAFKSSNTPLGTGLLDKYKISYKGIKKPVILYLNMYTSDPVWAPKGFSHQ